MNSRKKVFLSHSSNNKDLVRQIFSEMSSWAFFDEASFDTGDSFITSIERCIADSSIFVFFASVESLSSTWCIWETELALQRRIQHSIDRILVFIIDSDTSIENIPAFLKGSKISAGLSKKQMASIILENFFAVQNVEVPYFGRQIEEQKFQRDLYKKRRSDRIPNLYSIKGLIGMGRRSFIEKKMIPSLQNIFKYLAEIEINDGEDLTSLFLKVNKYSSSLDISALKSRLATLNEDEIKNDIVSNLIKLRASRFLPCLVDNGGIFSDNGKFMPYIDFLIERALQNNEIFCSIVSNRKIPIKYIDDFIEISIPSLA